ncbi:HAMP domain-containing sensor histidine kinase [Aurantimonas sp. VKM B-3413]|uniref:sensor histidine kinase n=1 Tax=Aurantimonas sp. VKM B-3413 TaxID=2779401 RepID=UPI001E592F46|nr:HAMP domain-containing histidine kinase [Aurantimonas sp. VKM B-3413]
MDRPRGEDRRPAGEELPGAVVRRRLSTRLLVITMLAVMLAEVLIFVPSIAKFRHDWLEAKIETAAVAGFASEQLSAEGSTVLGPNQEASLLSSLNADLVAINEGDASRLLARAETVDVPQIRVDLAEAGPLMLVAGAFDTLLFGGDRTMRITGPVGDGTIGAEVVMSERPLKRAMLIYSRNILILSLSIALFAALLVFGAISRYLIRPIQAMTASMIRFGENPADSGRIIVPSEREDEIGVAEAELASMQRRLADTLREQRHLADLGLAVSKINHDLRNILASAQMISDRLASVPDPRVQRFTPLLLKSLDRALHYTQSVLAYGRAVESTPVRRKVQMRRLVDDVFASLTVSPEAGIVLVNHVAEEAEIAVDPDQFHRVLLNLCRNAAEALQGEGSDQASVIKRIAVCMEALEPGETVIAVEDTGPGLPERARENLFKAFRGSVRTGGTGLGLAIAAEIVEAHGGRIRLAERDGPGARFEITLPTRSPTPLGSRHAVEAG